MNKLSNKLIVLLICCAIIPMFIYGFFSLFAFRKSNIETLTMDYIEIAKRSADQIDLFVSNSTRIIKVISGNLNSIVLKKWQKDGIIRNYLLTFKELDKLYMVNEREVIDLKNNSTLIEVEDYVSKGEIDRNYKVYRSNVFISNNLIPTMEILVTKFDAGIEKGVVGEINLTGLWTIVDNIKIGKGGYAFIVSNSGLLLVHGKQDGKEMALKNLNLNGEQIVKEVLEGGAKKFQYTRNGVDVIAVAAPIKGLNWGIIIERPMKDALKVTRKITIRLILLGIVFLLLMSSIGYFGGKKYVVKPILELINCTRAISKGNMERRVKINGSVEFFELGKSFNLMTEELICLQESIKKKERVALFGRIAGGLIHDLKHPIRNIENAARLIKGRYDKSTTQIFERIVKREFYNITRFLESLKNLTSLGSIKFLSLDLHTLIEDVVESFSEEAREKDIEITVEIKKEAKYVWADRFAIERVLNNLTVNAFYAMQDGGKLFISTYLDAEDKNMKYIFIGFADTGIGMSNDEINSIFDDFTSSKRMGLGLGLAECKKIVKAHNGDIIVDSIREKGTNFIVSLPTLKSIEKTKDVDLRNDSNPR